MQFRNSSNRPLFLIGIFLLLVFGLLGYVLEDAPINPISWSNKCRTFSHAWVGRSSEDVIKKFGQPNNIFPEPPEKGEAWSYYEKSRIAFIVKDHRVLYAELYDHKHLFPETGECQQWQH